MGGNCIFLKAPFWGRFQYFNMRSFLFTVDIDITSYTDVNTLYTTSRKANLAIEKLEQCSDSLFT